MRHLRDVWNVGRVVLLLLVTVCPATGQTVPASIVAPSASISLNLARYSSGAQLTSINRAPRTARSLSGGAKIAIGAGVGFALLGLPAYFGSKDPALMMGAGATGALLGAAMVYQLLQ